LTEVSAKSSPNTADGEIRETVIYWPEQVKAIVDGYNQYSGIPHGVQKDAIQNSWDARSTSKGTGWTIEFELRSDGKGISYLSFRDTGTFGLTGKVIPADKMVENLPDEERWARFESLAFVKGSNGGSLGSRGRGKFIFIGASKRLTILYDTLRVDGVYRLGKHWVEKTKCPVISWEGEAAKSKLQEETNGLFKPLETIGTRIIIVDPVDEVIEAWVNGTFDRAISETWWEIIQKFGAKIITKRVGKQTVIAVLPEFALPDKDSKEYKASVKENERVNPGGFKVKKMHIVSKRSGTVPNDIRGISVQRAGMKVTSIDVRYLPNEIASSIYGYVTLDEDAETLLRKDEGPEHYSIDFRRSFPGALRRYVEDQLGAFAREKLGWARDVRQIRREQQQLAERRALLAINKIARESGFFGTGGGSKEGSPEPRPWSKIRVRLPALTFPRKDDIRVNYGEKVQGIRVSAVNDSDIQINARLKMFLRNDQKELKTYVDEDLKIDSETAAEEFGPYEEAISTKNFPAIGRYVVVARMTVLSGKQKGSTIEEKRSFYVGQDPPAKGLFEKCEPVEYPDEAKALMGEAQSGEKGGYKLLYNVKHPAYLAIEDDQDQQAEYLFRLLSFELCRLDVIREKPVLFTPEEKGTSDGLLRKTLSVLGGFLNKYYGS
jgi:hypothetical protein